MQNFLLKKANKNDEMVVSRIMSAAYSRPWTHRHVAMAIENNQVWLYREEDGFIIYELVPPECEMSMMAVHPVAQRRGIGLQLVQHMVDECAQRKISKIFLEVEESNEAAVALYKKAGFNQFSKRQDYYGPARHALLMELQLVPETSI